MRRVTAFDLFAGCGGSSCGLMQAGIDVVAALEKNPTAVITYATNLCRYGRVKFHPLAQEDVDGLEREAARENSDGRSCRAGSGWIRSQPRVRGCRHIVVGDIRQLSGAAFLDVLGMKRGQLGMMAMSPPCQGFSTANTKRAKDFSGDPRNDLCFEAARLIIEMKPQAIFLENVPDFAKSPQCQLFKALIGGGEAAVHAFEHLLPTHPHWLPMLGLIPERVIFGGAK